MALTSTKIGVEGAAGFMTVFLIGAGAALLLEVIDQMLVPFVRRNLIAPVRTADFGA